MRIAIVNDIASQLGGLERYLTEFSKILSKKHELFLLTEQEVKGVPIFEGAHGLYQKDGMERLRQFQPDLISTHMVKSVSLLDELFEVAPTTLSVHNYESICISTQRRFRVPTFSQCTKVFGPSCLLQFYPRRCGGLNPKTMWADYVDHREKFKRLTRFSKVFTHAPWVKALFEKNGVSSSRLEMIPLGLNLSVEAYRKERRREDPLSLLFLGRVVSAKGGDVLIKALTKLQKALARSIELHIAGEGAELKRWQKLAGGLKGNIQVVFHGWVGEEKKKELLKKADLHVMPSRWPEPFGLSGLEAAAFGVPSVAFDVGGISTWLKDGKNGVLASTVGNAVDCLARAILKATSNPFVLQKLSEGARESVKENQLSRHVLEVESAFERLVTLAPAKQTQSG